MAQLLVIEDIFISDVSFNFDEMWWNCLMTEVFFLNFFLIFFFIFQEMLLQIFMVNVTCEVIQYYHLTNY